MFFHPILSNMISNVPLMLLVRPMLSELMLKDPANYHVDKSIVQMSLRAFYTILWNPANEMHNRVRRANTHARTCSRDRSTERGKQQVQSDRSSTAQVTPIPAFGKSWW